MGTLERLQRAILEYLRGIADLRCADFFAEGLDSLSIPISDKGLSVNILQIMPVKASKYAAGPTFSEVEIVLEVSTDYSISTRAPKLSTVAEMISRALHNWLPPFESGYAKLSLSDSSPWSFVRDAGVGKISIKFKAQSVLQ